jgi:hypothetical protein
MSILSKAMCAGVAVVGLCGAAASVRADVIANWTFDTTAPANAGPFTPENGAHASTAQATGFHAGSSTYSSPVGNGSAHAFSSNGWATNDYYQFQVDTTGYTAITFGWSETRSSTGPGTFDLQYRVGNSGSFTSLNGGYSVGTTSWSSTSTANGSIFPAVSAPLAANSAVVQFRLVCTQTGTIAAAGTNRIDDITISGNVMSAATGACCTALGVCTENVQQSDCSGTFTQNSTCAAAGCVATVGACCTSQGVCSAEAATCQNNTSPHLGTACTPNPCPAFVGACCNSVDGVCTMNFQDPVNNSCPVGTTPSGGGTTCTPNTCFQPMGACCDGNTATSGCTVQAANVCPAGFWLGVNVTCAAGVCAPPGVVFSQVYGGGGATTSSATYQQDYVELFNRSATSVDVSGWTVQYGSATGTTWTKCQAFPGGTNIAPGTYFLVVFGQGQGAFQGTDISAIADLLASPALSMSATTGKVVLSRTGTLLPTGACASGAIVADIVGYGGANCSEGNAAPTLTNTTAAFRNSGGCEDTDDNSANFTAGPALPRNTATEANPCGGAASGTCCAPTGACTFVAQADCSGGTWTTGGSCSPTPCPQPGVCCRGATCTARTTINDACTGNTLAGAVIVASAPACNSSGVTTTPCCYPDYNKIGGITVGDIFDFLNDWFAGSAFAIVGGDGNTGTLAVSNIFDFLNAWFAGGC